MTTARGPQFKVVLLGEVGVGKTSIFFRIKDDTYTERRRATLGIDSCSRLVKLEDKSHLTFSIWDTAGVERFRTLTKNYYRNTHVSVLIFSLDNPGTLHYLPKWMDDARDFSPSSLKVLVGNKSDLDQTVKQQLIENFADVNEIDLTFIISAKTGDGIDNMLNTIAKTLLERNRLTTSGGQQMTREELAKTSTKENRKPCAYC